MPLNNIQDLELYFQSKLGWGKSHESTIVFNFLLKAAALSKGGVILDAGSGHQRYKPFFSESTYIGQEHPIAGKINKGISKYDILCDVKCIPLKESSVDVILSTSSLEHIELPDSFFKEAFRVLKPGGALFVHVPFIYSEHEVPFDFQRPTRYGLHGYYSRSGFCNIDVKPCASSINTASYFFLHSVIEDATKKFGLSILGKIKRKLIYIPAKMISKFAVSTLDDGPDASTTFPVGWVSEGYKEGILNKLEKFTSTKDFINKKAHLGKDFINAEGVIMPQV